MSLLLPKPERRGPKPRKPIARGRRPRRQRNTWRAEVVRECDDLCRVEVKRRAGFRCEHCGRRGATDWAHGDGRRLSVRWAWWNTFSLCRDCHDEADLKKPEWWINLRHKYAREAFWLRTTPWCVWPLPTFRLVEIRDALARGEFLQGGRT